MTSRRVLPVEGNGRWVRIPREVRRIEIFREFRTLTWFEGMPSYHPMPVGSPVVDYALVDYALVA